MTQTSGGSGHEAAATAREILRRSHQRGFADVDPYDGLAGLADRILPPESALARRLVIQAVMRLPTSGVRKLLKIRPHREPYTLGVLLSAAVRLESTSALVGELLQVLLTDRLSDSRAWGYGFPVVTRAARYGPETPNVISTSFACLGLADLIESSRSGEWPEAEQALHDGVEWMTTDLWDPIQRGFRYHVGNPRFIYNASALAACVTGRAGQLLGTSVVVSPVPVAVGRLLEDQRPDGSWSYGDAPGLDWVDNHHTGFILKSLLLLPSSFRPASWEEATIRGLKFFASALIDRDGAPRVSPDRRYPIDSLAAGQAVETFALAGSVLSSPGWIEVSQRVFGWTEAHLRRRDGRFRFRLGRWLPWPGAYLRWGEAHIALGAAVLARSSGEPPG